MASAPQPPKTGESVVVSLGSLPAVNGQVRWVKGSRFGVLLFTALPVGAFRVADQGRGRQPRPPRHIVRIPARIEGQIGRASCRERVCQYVEHSVVHVTLKQNKPTAQ